MSKPVKILLVILLSTIITSCSILKPVDLSKVQIGMSKTEVAMALKRKPTAIVAAKHLTNPDTIIEVLQYVEAEDFCYYLYFVIDKLEEWHEGNPKDKRPPII